MPAWKRVVLLAFSVLVLVLYYSFNTPLPPSHPTLVLSSLTIIPVEDARLPPPAPPPKDFADDQLLLQLKSKVKVIITTVHANNQRIELLQQIYRNDPLAKDMFIFLSNREDANLGTITIPECNAFPSWLGAKCCRFTQFYFQLWPESYPDVEWVFKADDDSYVHPRNLLLTIASLARDKASSSKPLFLGDRTSWNPDTKRREDDPAYADMSSTQIWAHGGAGWLLNRAARDHLRQHKSSFWCGGLDDVGFGDWATQRGVPLTPYFGFHQRSTFEPTLYEEGEDFLGSLKPPAFFLCVKEDLIRLPYYPVTFHKLMATFPQLREVMEKKRFELIPLPELSPENERFGQGNKSDNYYRRIRPWLDDLAKKNGSYTHVDCHTFFDLAPVWKLKQERTLP